MKWKEFVRKWSWPNLKVLSPHPPGGTKETAKISVNIAGLRAKI
jgi:hypothetical protein